MMWLTEKIAFPPYENTSREGIIALGGDLSVERLIFAYKKGIFPWFSEGDPIVWYCPKKRMVLFPDELNISKSMKKVIQKNQLSKGGITGTLVDVRLALKTAIQVGAVGLILAHNHPSGNLSPSRADVEITKKVKKASETMDIRVLDHIILSGGEYYSFADEQLL